MHKFKIPQEVQREDRIFGPITFRRLIILTIGGGITYIIYTKLSSSGIAIWGLPTFFAAAITLSLAFIEPFGMRFSKFVLRMMEFLFLPRQRIWDKRFSHDTMFEFYTSEHKKWKRKNKSNIPEQSKREKKAAQRARLSEFSPLLDIDLSQIQIPKKNTK